MVSLIGPSCSRTCSRRSPDPNARQRHGASCESDRAKILRRSLPPTAEQRGIAAVLRGLADRIRSNRWLAVGLEEAAATLVAHQSSLNPAEPAAGACWPPRQGAVTSLWPPTRRCIGRLSGQPVITRSPGRAGKSESMSDHERLKPALPTAVQPPRAPGLGAREDRFWFRPRAAVCSSVPEWRQRSQRRRRT